MAAPAEKASAAVGRVAERLIAGDLKSPTGSHLASVRIRPRPLNSVFVGN